MKKLYKSYDQLSNIHKNSADMDKTKIYSILVEGSDYNFNQRSLYVSPGQKFIVNILAHCVKSSEDCDPDIGSIEFKAENDSPIIQVRKSKKGKLFEFQFQVSEVVGEETFKMKFEHKSVLVDKGENNALEIEGKISDLPSNLSHFRCGAGGKIYLKNTEMIDCEIQCKGIKSATGINLARNKQELNIFCNPSMFNIEIFDLNEKKSIGKGDDIIAKVNDNFITDSERLIFRIIPGSMVGAKYTIHVYLNDKSINTKSRDRIPGTEGVVIINHSTENIFDFYFWELLILVFVLIIFAFFLYRKLSK